MASTKAGPTIHNTLHLQPLRSARARNIINSATKPASNGRPSEAIHPNIIEVAAGECLPCLAWTDFHAVVVVFEGAAHGEDIGLMMP